MLAFERFGGSAEIWPPYTTQMRSIWVSMPKVGIGYGVRRVLSLLMITENILRSGQFSEHSSGDRSKFCTVRSRALTITDGPNVRRGGVAGRKRMSDAIIKLLRPALVL